MSRSLPVALALAVLSVAFVAVPAHAFLYTVTFYVKGAPDDPVHSADTATGTFSYDSSLIPSVLPGTIINSASGLHISTIDFTWAGHAWSRSDADAIFLHFDAAGTLTFWEVGGTPDGLNGITGGVYPDIDVSPTTGFLYTTSDSPANGIFQGTVTSWSVSTGNAPEPGTFALLGPGLLALGLVRRRKS